MGLMIKSRMPGEPPNLTDVEVWTALLDQPRSVLEVCVASLSRPELDRACRFATPKLRSHFAVTHAAIRHILARYTHRSPEQLQFVAGFHGKPVLPHSEWHFNITHSGAFVACAVTRMAPVGIDIERIHWMPDMQAIADAHFTRAEYKRLSALPVEDRTRGFFECWTRKEAFIKATGRGLSQRLDGFEVTFGPGSVPRILRVETLWTPLNAGKCALSIPE
jgi:4'-phosphopantetheinyl transferase